MIGSEEMPEVASGVEPPERFVVGEHAAFLYAPDGILQSTAGSAMLGKGGKAVTTRNWRTVLKLQRLLSAE